MVQENSPASSGGNTHLKLNDFVVRFANVNGTGSASANALFTKAVFRMGIPVTPKNIFPSNIQGLPTWYEVRVNEKGYLGRREGIDLMIAVNPQSMADDYHKVRKGGYFLYDSSKPLPPTYERPDITEIGIPLMTLCNAEYTDARQRQLFKNIVYIGALSVLCDIEFAVLEELIGEQFKGKEKLIEPNIKALNIGVKYVKENFDYPLDCRVSRRDLLGDAILFSGNSACGLGAIYGGATVAAWYPITPSTSVVDAFAKYAGKYRVDEKTGKNNYAIVQAEDELAAIGMVIGANWNGARSFTATSGPGVSLMNEFLGLAYYAEIPTVLIDVQRTGPSTGMPTRTQQSDILESRIRFARRYASSAAVSGVTEGMFRTRCRLVRPCRGASNACDRDDGPRPRDERPRHRPARLGRQTQIQTRKSARCGRTRGSGKLRALSRFGR